MGLEPTTFGITIRRSNQLSYIYHVWFGAAKITDRGQTKQHFYESLAGKVTEGGGMTALLQDNALYRPTHQICPTFAAWNPKLPRHSMTLN